jgi:hypothetical protein
MGQRPEEPVVLYVVLAESATAANRSRGTSGCKGA